MSPPLILRHEANALMMVSRRDSIVERDPLTRFSYAWGPLCRWPGATVEQVEKRVRDELALLRQVLRQNHGAVMLGQEQNAP